MVEGKDITGKASASAKGDNHFSMWISWQSHARTRNIAPQIGVPLAEITTDSAGLSRYLSLSLRTVWLLLARRPRVLIVQNPSLILTVLALALRPLFRYRLVVDAHNEVVEPYLHKQKPLLWLAKQCLRRADLTIVTNEPLADVVRKAGGEVFVLPDRIPEYTGECRSASVGKLVIVLISTYAKDEPIAEFIAAAAGHAEHVTVYVTGRAEKLAAEIRARAGSNVRFTGFLSEEKYWELLAGADAVADLTRMDNCLVCGAYEGVAAGKPLILSDNEATRQLFSKGALYVDNSVPSIDRALSLMREQRHELQLQTIALRQELCEAWDAAAKRLVARLHLPG